MREHRSPWIARGYLALISDELRKLEHAPQARQSADTVPLHCAFVASLNRAQLGFRLLEVSDQIMLLDRALAARAIDAASPWLQDAATLAARLKGADRKRVMPGDQSNHA